MKQNIIIETTAIKKETKGMPGITLGCYIQQLKRNRPTPQII